MARGDEGGDNPVDDCCRPLLDEQVRHIADKDQRWLTVAENRMLRAAPSKRPRPSGMMRRENG